MYKCSNDQCQKTHSAAKRKLCKQCHDTMQSSQQSQPPSNNQQSQRSSISNVDLDASLTNGALSNIENVGGCQSPQTPGNINADGNQHDIKNWIRNEDMANSNNYWENMNKLLDAKFNNFELKFKDSILREVKQITEPIQRSVNDLAAENKELRTQVTTLKAKTKEQDEKLDKVEKALREHHKTLVRSDKEARGKKLILAGVPETETRINEVDATDDDRKVKEVINILGVGDIPLVSVRRIGKKDQGPDDRPRYILLEFACFKDRNIVKKNGAKLKEREDSKSFFLKADLSKKEREEYKRIYDLKKNIETQEPGKPVRVEYGKLYVDETLVDQISTDNNDFL